MASALKKLPIGHSADNPVSTTAQIGELVRAQRRRLGLVQLDVAGMANTGNRFIVELEAGKPTVQLQKTLDVLDLLGLEVVVRAKSRHATPAPANAPGDAR